MYTDTGPGGVEERSGERPEPLDGRDRLNDHDGLDGFNVVNARNTARLFAMTASPPRQLHPDAEHSDDDDARARGGPEESKRMSQLFRVHKEDPAGASVLELALPDQLDDSDFDHLNESLLSMINDASQNWVIDLSEVNYMGSAMLGMMVNLRQQVKNARGRLVLFGMSQRLMDIFRTCCMERLFTITRTKAEALRMVK